MEKHQLAYVVYLNVWEDSEKVRSDHLKTLTRICELAFTESEVQDANDD